MRLRLSHLTRGIMEKEQEEETWVCRSCQKEGGYSVNPPEPKGWTCTEEHGLICKECTKYNNKRHRND
jgi:hypothetical protein